MRRSLLYVRSNCSVVVTSYDTDLGPNTQACCLVKSSVVVAVRFRQLTAQLEARAQLLGKPVILEAILYVEKHQECSLLAAKITCSPTVAAPRDLKCEA